MLIEVDNKEPIYATLINNNQEITIRLINQYRLRKPADLLIIINF